MNKYNHVIARRTLVSRGNLAFYGIVFLFILIACSRIPDEQTMALVGSEKITALQMRQHILRQKDIYTQEKLRGGAAFAQIKTKVLDELINKQLLLQEAAQQKVVVTEEEINSEIARYKSGYTEKDFQNILQKQGVNYQQWLQIKKENLIVGKFLHSDIFSNIEVSEAEINKYYQEHQSQYQIPEAVRVRQIVTDTKEKAENIYDRLMRGENFANLARNLSISPERKEGGDLGFVPKGAYPKVFDICFQMKPGEISQIIPSNYGYHIFKVIEFKPATQKKPFEVYEEIKHILKLQKREENLKEFVAGLRNKTSVQIFEKELKKLTL